MELARRSSSASDQAMDSRITSPAADKKMSNEDENMSAKSSTVTLSESDDTYSTKLESSNPSSITSEYKDFEEDYESQYSVEMSPEGDTEDLILQTAGITPEKIHTDESAASCDAVISEDTFTDSDEQDESEENCTTASSQVTKMEKPSPVSVLEIIYLEDETSPPSTKILQGGLPVVQLQIRFDEEEACESENSTSDQKYIQEILTLSGFSWENVYLRSLSSDQILDADLDILSDQPSNSYKLLFECVNEVLMEACVRYFGGFPLTSFSKHNIRIRPIPDAEEAFREIWQGVEWHLRPLSPPRSLEQMVEKDLIKDRRWMDLRFDAETICNEMEDIIFQELLEDTALSCFSKKTQKYQHKK